MKCFEFSRTDHLPTERAEYLPDGAGPATECLAAGREQMGAGHHLPRHRQAHPAGGNSGNGGGIPRHRHPARAEVCGPERSGDSRKGKGRGAGGHPPCQAQTREEKPHRLLAGGRLGLPSRDLGGDDLLS